MFSGKNQASQAPTALGSMLQASTYGMVIPVIYGRTQSPLLAIWANNLRKGGSSKKFKQLKKGGPPTYVENIDFLGGKNPILCPLQAWNNGTLLPLNFTTYSTSITSGSSGVITIPDAHFYAVIGVTLTVSYSETFDDYGAPGSSSVSGSMEVPLWNQLFAGPDPTGSSDPRNFPYRYRWEPSYGATIHLDDLPYGSLPSGTLKVYYAQLSSAIGNHTPISKLNLEFENILGSGDEYDGFGSQQIQYPWYAGLGSSAIDLGTAGAIPAIKMEWLGKWGLTPNGDCDFVDIIEDVIKSGITQAAMGADINFGATEHGASCYDLPGTIQKKLATSNSASGLPPMLYDMPNTQGNILVCVATGQAALSIASSNGETWKPLFGSGSSFNLWYATAVGGLNTVTVSGAAQPSEVAIFEIGGVGKASLSVDTLSVAPVSVSGSATGTVLKDFAASAVAAPQIIYGRWSDFVFMGPLPGDAVIHEIVPVINCRYINDNGLTGQIGWLNNSGGGGVPPPSSYGVVVGSSFGTDVTVALAGAQIVASIEGTVTTPQFTPPAEIDVASAGIAVLYSSATAPTPAAAYLPDPFTPPAGQYFVWALPATFTQQNFYSHPGPGAIFNAQGEQSAVGTAYEFSPAPAVTDTTPLLSVTDGVFSTDQLATSGGSGSFKASATPGWPEFILAVPFYPGNDSPASARVARWDALTPANMYDNSLASFQAHGKLIRNPGTFRFSAPGTTAMYLGAIGVRWTDAPSFARPAGNFIDGPSLELTRLQCRAGGLFGSLAMMSQQAARQWVTDLCDAADCAPVFSGHRLKLIPRSEVSAVGNGAVYVAPTAVGRSRI
jgi:hypothetical protein